MAHLVIGIPAYNEAATIADLADALELGSARLGEGVRCELALAYQPGSDDTLEIWQSRRSRIPHRVLRGPEGVTGKGRNVKMLMRHAQQAGAHLLLVDADLRAYPPSNVARFARPEVLSRAGLVLPLWCRPKGQGNSTDYLACPLLLSGYRARVRQPLAGQMLLSRQLIESVDVAELPDDYGIDIALTMCALEEGLPVEQVIVPFPDHDGGLHSHLIMMDVARALLRRLAVGPLADRSEVTVPPIWWKGLDPVAPSARSLLGLIHDLIPASELVAWTRLFDASPDVVRDMWCERLAGAVLRARSGQPVADLAAGLVIPFLIHAEYRRRIDIDVPGAEGYLSELCDRVAAAL